MCSSHILSFKSAWKKTLNRNKNIVKSQRLLK
jgi:hypothetical protein